MRKKKNPVKKLDALFSTLIKLPGKCHRCNSKYRLQCAHLISRSYRQIRWDWFNAIPLCSSCHYYMTHHPLEWEAHINRSFGPKRLQSLKKLALDYHKK